MGLPSNLLETTQQHLEELIADGTREGPHLDFKRDYPAAWDNPARHEFLADCTAFANAGGGDLIFGVDEDGEAGASALVPQALGNVDQEVRRLQDLLLNSAEPRVPGVQIHAAALDVAGTVGHAMIVRIPQSWAGPHRVKSNQHFFVRDGARKRQLDVPEIRALFLRSENQAQRVRDFRTERLGKILIGETPHALVEGPVLVAHLVPTQAALGLVQIDPTVYVRGRRLPLIGAQLDFARINIDGAFTVRAVGADGKTHGYTQLFRNGFFEATYVLTQQLQGGRINLPALAYEEFLLALLHNVRTELGQLGVDMECAVLLSLLRADQVKLGIGRNIWDFLDDHQTLFDRKIVVLPDVLADRGLVPEQAMKPAFDLMWQAAGLTGSRNYDEAGQRAPQR